MNFIEDREALIGFYPADPYNDGLIQLEALQHLGYDVCIDFVPNNSTDLVVATQEIAEKFQDDSWNRGLQKFSKWGRVMIGESMRPYVGIPDIPADPFHDVASEDSLLWDHPARLVSIVHFNSIEGLLLETERLLGLRDWYPKFSHDRADYPWLQVVGSCFMRIVNNTQKQEFNSHGYSKEVEHYLKIYQMLQSIGIRPISPEGLCGIMVDFYRKVEEEIPDFGALKLTKTGALY